MVTPSRPYLVRALHQWILDNHCTPYLLVDASLQGVSVPEDYVDGGKLCSISARRGGAGIID